MCQSATNSGGPVRADRLSIRPLPLLLGLVACLGVLPAQTAPARADWRHIGNSAVDAALASPAAGPVDRVWYSGDGSRLYVRTGSGRVFETSDYEKWQPSTAVPPPAKPDDAGRPLPDGSAALRRNPADPARLYAFGGNVFRSDDGGESWANVTAFRRSSIIGGGMRDLAVSPRDRDEVVVANERGLWRSLDGGLSWTGLNESLPNLPARRFAALPQTTAGVRIVAEGYGVAEWAPGEKRAWRPIGESAEDAAARRALSSVLSAEITATAAAGELVYAGSADGRIWVSTDRGHTWNSPAPAERGRVTAIFADSREPRTALAALAADPRHPKAARVLRSVNSGQYWDDLTSDLPEGDVYGIAADRASGTVYAAAERGLFLTRADLNAPAPAGRWIAIAGLPQARALDVALDPDGNQLFVVLEGYGVYAAMAPHRLDNPRLVNAADFSARAAAPGSLLSVLGGRVTAARAGDLVFPVLATSETESQIQVPFTVRGPAVSLALETGRGSLRLAVPVEEVSPAIFVDRDGTPLVLNADTGVLLDGMNPARSNSRLQILATGLGAVRPEWPSGMAGPADDPPQVVAPVRVFLDRAPLEVSRAVLAPGYIGLYLIEVQLPAIVNYGPAELYVEADGHASNRVRIDFEP